MSTATIEFTDATHRTDDELMETIQAGHGEHSLAVLRERHGARVRSLARHILHDRHLAEDVCEETFSKVYLKCDLYRPRSNFIAWLLEITRNQALSTLRSHRLLPRTATALAADSGVASEDLLDNIRGGYQDRLVEERELMAKFDEALRELPDDYRVPFQMCARDGMEYRQAAEALDIPTGTVAIRIMRARKRLFRALSRHMGRIRRPPACFN